MNKSDKSPTLPGIYNLAEETGHKPVKYMGEGKEGTTKDWLGQGSLEQTYEEEEGGSHVDAWTSPERLSNLPGSHSK